MFDNKRKPILVSHPGMGLISGTQKEIVERLGRFATDRLSWRQIRAVVEPGSKLTAKETTQFSRSFLYLTLGAIYALTLGLETEFIFENGVLALNMPLTQSRIYTNTRTAHPHFLKMYEQLLARLFGTHIAIENPFVGLTKGEVTKFLDAVGFRDLVGVAMSCPNVTRLRWKGVSTSKTRHCGICFPCVIRRASIHNANLWSEDATYADDITAPFETIPEEGKKLLFEMMDFLRQVDKCSTVDEAFNEFPQFFIGEEIDPVVLFDMTKRHSAQFKDFLSQRADRTLRRNLGLP